MFQRYSFKGQLISEMSFWCLQIYLKNNKIFVRISALASKKRTNRDTLYHQLGVILWYNVPLFFDQPFLKAMAEILKQNPLGFLVYLKAPRSFFEIKWPLMVYWASSWIFQNLDPSLNWDIEILSTKFSNGFSESHTWFTGHSFQSGGYWSCS